MKHARSDYNRIQDPENKIPENEPVFLLRAQDISAPEVVAFWAILNKQKGGDPAMSVRAKEWARKMKDYQEKHGSKPADWPEQEETK